MKMSRYFGAAAVAAMLGLCVHAHAATLISPMMNNGGFETALGGTVVSGGSSGDGNIVGGGDRFAANNGVISVPGWDTIDASGFAGLDGSQINDFTTPPPSNGQDVSPNKGINDSRRVLLANNAVEVTATSSDVGGGLVGDVFDLSFWTAGNSTSDNHFIVDASILFDGSISVAFNSITHTESDEASGTLADNTTTGFIFRDNAALGSVVAPAAYSTAQLVLFVDNNGTDGANEGDQVYLDNVTLDVTSIPEPASLALFALGMCSLGVARRRK